MLQKRREGDGSAEEGGDKRRTGTGDSRRRDNDLLVLVLALLVLVHPVVLWRNEKGNVSWWTDEGRSRRRQTMSSWMSKGRLPRSSTMETLSQQRERRGSAGKQREIRSRRRANEPVEHLLLEQPLRNYLDLIPLGRQEHSSSLPSGLDELSDLQRRNKDKPVSPRTQIRRTAHADPPRRRASAPSSR